MNVNYKMILHWWRDWGCEGNMSKNLNESKEGLSDILKVFSLSGQSVLTGYDHMNEIFLLSLKFFPVSCSYKAKACEASSCSLVSSPPVSSDLNYRHSLFTHWMWLSGLFSRHFCASTHVLFTLGFNMRDTSLNMSVNNHQDSLQSNHSNHLSRWSGTNSASCLL